MIIHSKAFWGPWKVTFSVCYADLTPSWGQKSLWGPHMDWYSQFYVFPRQPTKKKTLSVNFVHFFSFSPIINFFGSIFGRFRPPLEAQSLPEVPLWTLTPSFSIWGGDQPKIGPQLQILFIFSIYLSFLSIWSLLGAFLGHFRAPPVAYGMPKVATWSWVPSYTILDDQQPKIEFLYNDYSF